MQRADITLYLAIAAFVLLMVAYGYSLTHGELSYDQAQFNVLNAKTQEELGRACAEFDDEPVSRKPARCYDLVGE